MFLDGTAIISKRSHHVHITQSIFPSFGANPTACRWTFLEENCQSFSAGLNRLRSSAETARSISTTCPSLRYNLRVEPTWRRHLARHVHLSNASFLCPRGLRHESRKRASTSHELFVFLTAELSNLHFDCFKVLLVLGRHTLTRKNLQCTDAIIAAQQGSIPLAPHTFFVHCIEQKHSSLTSAGLW